MPVLTSCNYHSDKKPATKQNMENGADLGFQEITSLVFKPECYSCHGNGQSSGGVNFETYEQVQQTLSDINQYAVLDKTMPPNGMADSLILLLKQWLEANAPLSKHI